MQKSNLLPVTALTVNQLIDENGISKMMYLKGYPRQYRFDASKGLFNVNGEQNLTTSKQPFRFVPLAYRVFVDTLFNYSEMKWTEFFFLNGDMQVCSTLFHEFSTQTFLDYAHNHLFYMGLNPCQAVWTVVPNEKTNQLHGSKYYIATFCAEPMDTETKEAVEVARTMLDSLLRMDTLTDNCKPIASLFYGDTEGVQMQLNEAATESKAEKLDRHNDKASKNFAKGVVSAVTV